jgi:hypothetical protein
LSLMPWALTNTYKSDKCTLRGQHFIIIVQEGTNDVGHGGLRAAAKGDIVDLGGKALSQGFSQIGAAQVRVAVDLEGASPAWQPGLMAAVLEGSRWRPC